MAAGQGLVVATEALVGLCSERVRELESLAVIIGQGKEDELTVFAQQLALVESTLGDVVDRVQRDLACAERAKETAKGLQAAAMRMANLDVFFSKVRAIGYFCISRRKTHSSLGIAPWRDALLYFNIV